MVEVNNKWRCWYPSKEEQRQRQEDRFERNASEAFEKQISDRVEAYYESAIGSDHCFWDFDADGVVSSDDWSAFIIEWKRWPKLKDRDRDGDGRPDWKDLCPKDENKFEPADCGCGNEDVDLNGNGIPDCVDPSPSMFLDAPSSHIIGNGEDLRLDVSGQHESQGMSVVFRSTRSGISASQGLYVDYQKPFEYPSEAIDLIEPGFVTAQALVRIEGDVVETISHALEIN
jgi:hypothetical protein